LSSSGEPTLSPRSVTKTLELINRCKSEGISFFPINLYSNGIRIGFDDTIAEHYLPMWKQSGLTNIYLTVHDVDERKNAEVYGVKEYPQIREIVHRIHRVGLSVRANLVLNKNTIGTAEKFVYTVQQLKDGGFDSISAWCIRDRNDQIDRNLSPLEEELDKMEDYIEKEGSKVRLLRENHRGVYTSGSKLTLFPDGTLSSSWCNH